VSEEALTRGGVESVAQWLASQPPWSDLPIVVLTSSGRPNPATRKKARELEALGNITFLERPARPDTLRSSVRAALRARLRQYEMRRRQEMLSRLNADLEQFAHSASHDLQEPLRNVAIYSELLGRRYASAIDAQGLQFLEHVRLGALRMQSLVHDLLCYTQAANVEDGVSEPVSEPIDAGEAMDSALTNLRESIMQSGASIRSDRLPAVKMRAVHLQQLFQNLIGNAIKYRREEPPRVHITAMKKDGYWLFAVADNGIGIHPDCKEQIFGVFKRLHTNDKYAGTGIGLAICQRIAERYRGRIWAESEPGNGSTFYFTIPA
jgi:light-regulated signal transduction histidine kinase (bacteriophytochrome)